MSQGMFLIIDISKRKIVPKKNRETVRVSESK